MNDLTKLKHQDDPLARHFYEKLKRLPLEELLFLREELEKIRVQEQRSKFKLIKGQSRGSGASAGQG